METSSGSARTIISRGNHRCWWFPAKSSVEDFTQPQQEVFTLSAFNPKFPSPRHRRGYENIQSVNPGDLLFGYVTKPKKQIVVILRITKSLDYDGTIEFQRIKVLANPAEWSELQTIPVLSKANWPNSEGGFRSFLTAVPNDIADAILKVIGNDTSDTPPMKDAGNSLPPSTSETAKSDGAASESDVAADALDDLEAHKGELDALPPTEREEVRKSRIGQGKFRKDLIAYWETCAVTGCTEKRILRASHIQPWRDSDNRERLDPFNGLLLAPQLDALFDAGFVSFADSGQILRSTNLYDDDYRRLGVREDLKLRPIDEQHKKYLRIHREMHGFDQ